VILMVRASKRRLDELTAKMRQDLDAWRRFAEALVEAKALFAKAGDPIRELGYEDFDSYCMEEFQIASREALRKISNLRVARKIDPAGEIFGTENQVTRFAAEQGTTVPRLATHLESLSQDELEEKIDQAEQRLTDPIVTAERKWIELHDRTLGLVDRTRKATAKYRYARQIGKALDRIEEFIGLEEFSADRAA
jgi:DNA-binding helix-hairpin-helix protein with protein kinase domain